LQKRLAATMKRHPSLHPLSAHHHHALVQALEIRRAGQLPAAQRRAGLQRAAKMFLRFWRQVGRKHFREEEEVLLPAYARRARLDDDPTVLRMLADHASIRARVEDLEAALAAKRPVETVLVALGQLLHDHVRWEEEQVFPRIEAALSPAELLGLSQRLTPLHGKKRG